MELMGRGAEMLGRVRGAHLARPVTYRRGEQSAQLSAAIGSTAFERTDDHGVIHRVESRDYLIAAADLVLAGAPTQATAGDRIEEHGQEGLHVYEVVAPAGEPVWRYSDPQRRTLRIHTKLVRTETS
ncbi:MAG: hypothetical protein JJU33_09335 [Phycisphaerales bacterium]|nr:hypothetical protein [Phycisphaerales bacterium]